MAEVEEGLTLHVIAEDESVFERMEANLQRWSARLNLEVEELIQLPLPHHREEGGKKYIAISDVKEHSLLLQVHRDFFLEAKLCYDTYKKEADKTNSAWHVKLTKDTNATVMHWVPKHVPAGGEIYLAIPFVRSSLVALWGGPFIAMADGKTGYDVEGLVLSPGIQGLGADQVALA